MMSLASLFIVFMGFVIIILCGSKSTNMFIAIPWICWHYLIAGSIYEGGFNKFPATLGFEG